MTKPIKDTPLLGSCHFSVVAQSNASDTLSYYERLRGYVEHEDGLINSRLTWSLTIHGFLFATYGILLGKVAEMLIELSKLPAGASPKLLVYGIAGLFIFQLPIAGIGMFVSYYSREAIVGAHNALQHVYAIAHSSGALRIPQERTRVSHEIAEGVQTVKPSSMSGIREDSQILVANGQESEETVTVRAVHEDTFAATFVSYHAAGASLTPVGSILLPKIVSGGGPHTASVSDYYTELPCCMFVVWSLLFGASAVLLFLSLSAPARCWILRHV